MSRVSRVNVDVTATTTGLEAGMRRAEQRVDGFAQRVEGVKGGLEKLRGIVGLGAGGFGVVGLFSAAIRSVDATVNSLADATERASTALDRLRKTGAPLSEVGLTPTTARSLASIAPQARSLRSRGSVSALSDTFIGEALIGRDAAQALSSAVNGARGVAAGYGAAFNQAFSPRLSPFIASNVRSDEVLNGRRMADEIGGAILEAISPDDQASAVSIGRAFLRSIGDETYRSMILGRGAR